MQFCKKIFLSSALCHCISTHSNAKYLETSHPNLTIFLLSKHFSTIINRKRKDLIKKKKKRKKKRCKTVGSGKQCRYTRSTHHRIKVPLKA
uniref:Guanylate-binding protein 5 n=1 Tax=Rhizophora mucronata TaxID=61149 RepID=A0A2P2MHX2_RHIMU